jgi:fatty acid desaturase (delta-4 desaturase)
MVMQGVAFSWLYMVGMDCSRANFFRGSLNEWAGVIVLAPLLRPLQALREKGTESRALVYRLMDSFFGVSVSHLAVDAFLVVAIPWMYWKLGMWGIFKYWFLPLVFCHLNGGNFLKSKAASNFMFPELGDVNIPFYSLTEELGQKMHKMVEEQRRSWQSPLWPATRELLLWKRRDWLLHAFLLAGGILALLNAPQVQMWAFVPVLLVIPFLAWQSSAARAVSQVSEKLPQAMKYTLSELWQNNSLIAVEGKVVDVEKLAAVHPGGDQIRACGGTDCTALFGSMHTFTREKNLKAMEKFQVGVLVEEKEPLATAAVTSPKYEMNSPFAQELKTAMRAALNGVSPYAPTAWWIRFGVICASTLVCEVWWAMKGSWLAMICVGVLHALIGIAVQHDGSHGAVSNKAWINSLVAYGADWIGSSKWLWFQQHIIGHHPHCNVEGKDPDAHSAEPLLQFHWTPQIARQWFLAHQWLYMYLVLPWYGPTVIYNLSQLVTMNHGDEVPESSWLLSKRPVAVLMRLFYLARIVLAPMLLAQVSWLPAMIGVPLVTGFVLTFVFVVSHNFTGSDRDPLSKSGEATDFYKLQVETSCSYGGWLSMVFSGGLNMQIEHHLWPRLNSWHYPTIQAAVRKVCKAHGVRYTYFPTLYDNVVDTIRYMRFVGDQVSSKPLVAPEHGATTTKSSEKKEEELWIQFGSKMLNVTKWVEVHPGGSSVIRVFKDRDAQEQFMAMHSETAKRQLKNMLASSKLTREIEEHVKPSKAKAMEAFFALRREMEEEGMFKTPWLQEGFRLALHLSFYVIGFCLMRFTSYLWTGAMVYAWGMQQSGWVSHDYLHHQVFSKVWMNDWMGSFLGWLQAYDGLWWKDRHNLHHVATNEEGNDPDVDLAPLLTYVNKNVSLNFMQSYQHIYFIPLLSLLHFAWMSSSIRFTIKEKMWKRTFALVLNHLFMFFVVYRSGEGAFLLPHLLVGWIFKGMLTAIFVFSTHYPEDRLPPGADDMSFCEQTALTSRNIGGGFIVDYMSGHISRQIEHHLFPMLPRQYLVAVAPRVQKLFKELGLPYNETSIVECMKANVQCLSAEKDVEAKALKKKK